MVFDTPIFDNAVMEQVIKNPESYGIEDRYARTTMFRSYLIATWHDSGIEAPYFEWNQLVQAGEDSFNSVDRFVTSKRQF